MDFTINGLVYRTIEGKNNEVILLKTEGLKRPVRNIPAEVEYNEKNIKLLKSQEVIKFTINIKVLFKGTQHSLIYLCRKL